MMEPQAIDRTGAMARALLDRIAFLVESFAVGLVLVVFLGLAAVRFDLSGAAYVWGLFWMRVAESDEAARAPVLGLLGCLMVVTTAIVACVRWSKASRAFDAFPLSRKAQARMLERLG